MLSRIVGSSIRYPFVVLGAVVLLAAAGGFALSSLPMDAVPDLTNVQVQVLTNAPALGPVDVERLVSAPVELAMTGLPDLEELRSISRYGTSAVTVVFADGVDPTTARMLVNERIPRARRAVQAEYGEPEMGPPSTGLGEIYQFEVQGEGHSPMALRALLDWQIAPRLRLVPGVVEVNAFGGELKTYEVAVDPRKLAAAQTSFAELFAALARNNRSVGGGAIHRGPEGLLVRGEGLVESIHDIADIAVKSCRGVPVYVRQLGEVRLAPMLRQGAASRDGRGEIVAGMAMMLQGKNSRQVAKAVQAEVTRLNQELPAGLRIVPFYDRTSLVDQTMQTVVHNLIEGGCLVVFVLVIMLRNLRAGCIAAAVIPLSMLVAFIGMRLLGVSGNLMSLGAIDFGLVVDGAIIMLENSLHHISAHRQQLGRSLNWDERRQVVCAAALEVRSATAFGELIIGLVYLPILTLQGVEGKLFHPMALTVLCALGGAFLLSLTFVPAAISLFIPGDTVDRESFLLTRVRKFYRPTLSRAIASPRRTTFMALMFVGAAAVVAAGLGTEFIPRLDEGALIIETNRLPSTSLEESVRQSSIAESILCKFPEVKTVVTKTGRPEIANDPMGVEQSDIYVMLKSRDDWPQDVPREALIADMTQQLHQALPGASFGFSQPIEMRMNELVSGVRADFAVKIYGDDFSTLADLGARVHRALSQVQGAADLKVDRVAGLPVLKVSMDRQGLARHGVAASDVLDAIETVGGRSVGSVLEGRKSFQLRVRLTPEARADRTAIQRMPIRTANGSFVPLEELAQVQQVDEPLQISREATARRLFVQANVRGRDLGGFAAEAQRVIGREVHLPAGYHLEFGGQFENLERATQRLRLVVPLTLLLIAGLLYITFRRIGPVLMILTSIPFAASGGILALALRGLPFSVSAAVGLVALFGVAVLNGLVLVSQVQSQLALGLAPAQAALEGAVRRLRPVMTTALVASLGFIPMAFADGSGAEVQRPLATVVIGGLLTSTILTLFVLPALLSWAGSSVKGRSLSFGSRYQSAEAHSEFRP
jgi:cobalt-zinc-cadmium resistance protein CzcA